MCECEYLSIIIKPAQLHLATDQLHGVKKYFSRPDTVFVPSWGIDVKRYHPRERKSFFFLCGTEFPGAGKKFFRSEEVRVRGEARVGHARNTTVRG